MLDYLKFHFLHMRVPLCPLQVETSRNGAENPYDIDVVVFPGKDGVFNLYEDDGVSLEYKQNGGGCTEFRSTCDDQSISVRISPATGDINCIPQKRSYRILIRGVGNPDQHSADIDGKTMDSPAIYDEASRTFIFEPLKIGINQALTVEIKSNDRSIFAAPDPVETRAARASFTVQEWIR